MFQLRFVLVVCVYLFGFASEGARTEGFKDYKLKARKRRGLWLVGLDSLLFQLMFVFLLCLLVYLARRR